MRSFCSSKTFVFRVANGECCLRSCCRCVRVRVAFSCGTSSSISIILCVCVCACGSVHILDRKKFFSCGTSSIFHHFAPVGMAPCVFWIVMSLFCRLHFQSSCVSAFIILRERIVVFSCSPLRFLPLCVCVTHLNRCKTSAGGMAAVSLAMPTKLWDSAGRERGRTLLYLQYIYCPAPGRI